MKSIAKMWIPVLAAVVVTGTDVTPIQKVVQLLHGMLEKGKTEKHAEQVQFAAFKQFCDDATVEKQRSIAQAKEDIEGLKASIQKYGADAAQLGKEITGHDADISAWTGDKKAASSVRKLEKVDYDKLHKDYSESVDALQRAIAVLKKQAFDRTQVSSFQQLSALKSLALIPAEAKKTLDLFLMQEPDSPEGLAISPPEAYGYEFQSRGIVEMLEKLLDKFITERTEIEKSEMNSKHAYEMLVQDLTAQIDQSTTDRGQKVETKAKKLQAKADKSGDLKDTSSSKEADEKYLSDMTATCQQKASDFESRQQLRTSELEAISKAVEIISSDAVSGHADKLPSMMQKSITSFAQLRSGNSNQQMVARYLRQRAQSLNSRVLSVIATRVADDPFVKVKKLIKDLILRLMQEANEEATHKGWCDTELSTNEQTRKEKTEAVQTLYSEIDQLKASIAKLGEDIIELTKAVADLDSNMAKATKIRADEKSQNTETIKDAGEAQTAVAQALTVLKEFYAGAAEATAFVQQPMPAIFDRPYKGMQAENGGVVGMLEVIESDFARLEAETEAAEASAQKKYDELMTDSKVDKAAKTSDIEHKRAKKQDQEQASLSKQSDLAGTQKELDASLSYFEKLKPACVDAGVSYDERVGRRKEEIESLQEALRILNGDDIA